MGFPSLVKVDLQIRMPEKQPLAYNVSVGYCVFLTVSLDACQLMGR
jgi:hypothetical protein